MSKNTNEIRGYKIDHNSNVIYINYKFSSEAGKFGTPEYKFLKALKEDFPHYAVSTKSGRTNKSGPNSRLRYENMRTYIGTFENSEELLETMDIVIARSKALKSPYKYVRNWFELQFPDYKTSNTAPNNAKITLIGIPDEKEYQKKEA